MEFSLARAWHWALKQRVRVQSEAWKRSTSQLFQGHQNRADVQGGGAGEAVNAAAWPHGPRPIPN